MSTADTNVEQGDAARGWFQTTHWSVVLGTGLEETARADAALSNLCRAYWYPVYSYLRRVGHGPEDAEDLTQEFFARLLTKRFLKGIGPGRGKFCEDRMWRRSSKSRSCFGTTWDTSCERGLSCQTTCTYSSACWTC